MGARRGRVNAVSVRIRDANARQAFQMLESCGPRGRKLAAEMERRGTRVWVTPRIQGGLTLNFINSIFIMPLPANATERTWNTWVSLLAHEACHIEQRFWVDSVEQEMIAYRTQVQVGDELGVDLSGWNVFATLNPKDPQDQLCARAALLTLFANTPAAMVYASLPLAQPRRLRAIMPGARELAAVLRAAFSLEKVNLSGFDRQT
jgi:hypothetical protein